MTNPMSRSTAWKKANPDRVREKQKLLMRRKRAEKKANQPATEPVF